MLGIMILANSELSELSERPIIPEIPLSQSHAGSVELTLARQTELALRLLNASPNTKILDLSDNQTDKFALEAFARVWGIIAATTNPEENQPIEFNQDTTIENLFGQKRHLKSIMHSI